MERTTYFSVTMPKNISTIAKNYQILKEHSTQTIINKI